MRGSIALLLVIITLTLLSALVVEINYRSQVSATVVTNRRDGEKAYQLARAAVRWSVFRLQLDTALDRTIPAIPNTNYGGRKDDLSEVQWAVPLPYPFAAASIARAMGGPSAEPEVAAEAPDLGGSFLSVVTDESSKINLNDVWTMAPPGVQPQASPTAVVFENLLLSPRFQVFFKNADHRELIWAIDDWTDADSQVNHLGGGIEDLEYKSDDRSLHVKNAPFYSVRELRLLKPMTPELFRELEPFVTVYPFDRLPRYNTAAASEPKRINVNTAPLEIIAALFSREAIPAPRERYLCAQNIVKYRKTAAFRSVSGGAAGFVEAAAELCGFRASPGGPELFPPGVRTILDVRSDVFSVEATGSVNQTEKTIRAVVERANPVQPKILYWKVL